MSGLRVVVFVGLVCSMGSLVPSPAQAQAQGQRVASILAESDGNGDGKLQRSEAPVGLLVSFSEIDRDGDGAIDSFEAWKYDTRRRRAEQTPAAPPTGRQAGPAEPRERPKTLVDLVEAGDRDGDGRLSIEEVPQSQREGFLRLDPNQDGFIDLAEAKDLDERRQRSQRAREPGATSDAPAPPRRARRTLVREVQLMDTDGDGKLQKREAPLRVQEIFDRVDRNADGAIDADEAAAGDAAGIVPEPLRGRRGPR